MANEGLYVVGRQVDASYLLGDKEIVAAPDGSSMLDEAAFLARVAQAQRKSSIVRTVLDRIERQGTGVHLVEQGAERR